MFSSILKLSSAGATCVLLVAVTQAQEARWDQLGTQVVQLMDQGNYAAALPLAQQEERVAEATWGSNDQHLAVTEGVLANLNLALEKFSDAEVNLKRAIAIYTKLEGPEGKDTANELGNLGSVYLQEANYPAAEQAVRQALDIAEKTQGENSRLVATTASNLAMIYKHEDKYADAEPLYKKGVAINLKLGRAADAAASLDGLGTLYLAMRRFPDAEQAYGQALDLELKAPATDHPHIGLTLANMATAYQEEGKFTEAEQTYGKAMAYEQKENPPDMDTVAGIESDVGALFRQEGKYPQSEAILVQALQNRAKVLGPYHPEVAGILENLGDLYFFESRFSDADRALQQAIAIDVKSLGPDKLGTAKIVADLAMLHGNYGDYASADTLYHQAIPIYLKVLGQNDERVADLLYHLAVIQLHEEKLDDAVKTAEAAAAIYQKVDGTSNRGYAQSLDLLGAMAEDVKNHDVAEKLHKQALSIYEKLDGPDSVNVTESLEGLAKIYKTQQKFADAEPLLLRCLKIEQAHITPHDTSLGEVQAELAALYYAWSKPQQAAPYFHDYLGNLMDEFRANAATMSERDRLYYFAAYRSAFPMFFSYVMMFYKQMPELTGEMYNAILAEKGIIAENATAMRAAVAASGDPQAVQMLDKLTSDKAQVAALAQSSVGDPANYRAQMDKIATEANQLEGELLKRSAAMGRQKTQNAATWQDVQKALKPGEAAVEIVRFQFYTGIEPTADVGYNALVVTPDCKQPELVLLGEAKDLEAAPMLAYRDDVGQTRGFEQETAPGAAGQPAGAVANTSAAYAAFWKPLEPALGTAKRVYVSPDGVLMTIPMGVMADSDGKLLMEKVQLRIVNSTKDLLLPAQVSQSKNALVVGNPKFDLTAVQQKTAIAQLRGGATGAGSQQASAQIAQVSNAGAAQVNARGDLKGGDLPPLPGTQLEVDTVNKLLKTAGWQPTEYTGELALKDTVAQSHAPRVVHIATHGFFLSDEELKATAEEQGTTANVNEDPMLRAGLFFAGADRTRAGTPPEAGVDDGVLTAYEASQLNLEGTELVVLSACETGLGKSFNVEGVFGLRRGLQEAGAESLLMSMWSVPDKETQELMALFYQKWLGGTEKAEALRQAQLEERETVKKRYGKDLPFYWGAFVLVGK